MTLKILNSFFTSDDGLDKPLFVSDDTIYNKGMVKRLIQKYVTVAERIKEPECILCVQDNLLFIIAYFALLHSGKTIILSSNVREATLNMLGIKNIFTDSVDELSGYNFHKLDLEEVEVNAEIKPFDSKAAKVVFFTSGSTGVPKRITKSFYCLCKELEAVDELLGSRINNNLTTIMTVNVFHLFGMTFAFLYSMAKGLLIDTKRVDTPEELSFKLGKHKNTFLISSPAFLDRLARYKNQYAFETEPAVIMSSGGPLSTQGAQAAKDLLGTSPIEIFGSTETGMVGYRCQLEDEKWTVPDMMIAKTGEDGRLHVKSEYIDGGEYIMGDSAEFVSANKFILKGRLDRMVKIEEKRVSLPELETALNAHKYVDKAYCLPVKNKNQRINVGACISLNHEGRRFILSKGRKELVDELKSHMIEHADKVAVPSKWRFVDEIPVNVQSKVLVSEIENMFASNLSEPVIFAKDINTDTAVFELSFLEGSSYFEGHFPNFALLPGVAQIHFAVYFGHKLWADIIPSIDIDIEKMTKIKFSNMIRPNQILKLSLSRNEQELSFRYFDDNGNYSSGTFLIRK